MNIQDVLDELDLTPDRGNKLMCPGHDKETASLHVYDEHFYCYGCHKTGDSYGLIAAMSGKPLIEVFRLYKPRDGSAPSKMTQDLVGPQALNQRVKRAWSDLNRHVFRRVAEVFSEYDEHIGRKLATVLHALWRSGEVYRPLRNSPELQPAA